MSPGLDYFNFLFQLLISTSYFNLLYFYLHASTSFSSHFKSSIHSLLQIGKWQAHYWRGLDIIHTRRVHITSSWIYFHSKAVSVCVVSSSCHAHLCVCVWGVCVCGVCVCVGYVCVCEECVCVCEECVWCVCVGVVCVRSVCVCVCEVCVWGVCVCVWLFIPKEHNNNNCLLYHVVKVTSV